MSALTGITQENAEEFAEVVSGEAGGLILALMGQMERDSQHTANMIRDIRESQLNTARQDFLNLYEAVLFVAEKSDSMRLHKALADFHWRADFHYEDMHRGEN